MCGGIHFVYNALCAVSVGAKCNIEVEKILEGIEEFELTKGRMEIIKTKNEIKIINDTYNASLDSMKAALEYLKSTSGNRKIAILGDILELGDFAKEIHEKVGEEVYNNNIDILITVGENAKYIASKALNLGMEENKIFSYNENGEAIQKINSIVKEKDFILVKASNGMKFKEIVEKII